MIRYRQNLSPKFYLANNTKVSELALNLQLKEPLPHCAAKLALCEQYVSYTNKVMRLIRFGMLRISIPWMRVVDWTMFGALAIWVLALLFAGKMEPSLTWTGPAKKEFYEKLPYWDFRALSALGIYEDDNLDPKPFLKRMKTAGITFSEGEFKDQLGARKTISQVVELMAHAQVGD